MPLVLAAEYQELTAVCSTAGVIVPLYQLLPVTPAG